MSAIQSGGQSGSNPPRTSAPGRAPLACTLRSREGEAEHRLAPGETVVGRSPRCELVLDDALVSRRHARFVLENDALTLEDLGSVNGVYVNGARIDAPLLLHEGDRVLIGREIYVVHFEEPEAPSAQRVTRRPPAPTMPPPAPDHLPPRPTSGTHRLPTDAFTTTDEGSGLDVLSLLADKVLALGRGEDAEKILSGRLQSVLRGAREGAPLPPETCDMAGRCALKLASATNKAVWVDYLVELYTLCGRVWPAPVIDELHAILRRVPSFSLARLREYLRVLQSASGSFGPAERFLLQRIEGLERTAAKQT